MKINITTIWAFLVFIQLFQYSSFSQPVDRSDNKKLIDLGVDHQYYRLGDMTLAETSFPLQFVYPLSEKISLNINNTPVIISREYPDEKNSYNHITNKISTITDTYIGLKYLFPDNNGLLNLYLGLPTGKKSFLDEEFNTALYLGIIVLNYRTQVLGQGLGAGGSFIYSIPLNESHKFSLGVLYNLKTKYTSLKSRFQEIDNVLGNDIGFSLSYTFIVSSSLRFSIYSIYSTFMKDRISYKTFDLNSNTIENEYQSGDKLNITTQMNYQTGIVNHNLILQNRIKGKNKSRTFDSSILTTPAWFEVGNEPQIEGSYNANVYLNSSFSLLAQAQFSMCGSVQNNWHGVIIKTNRSSILGGGVGISYYPTQIFGIKALGKYLNGKVKFGQEKERDVKGFDILVSLNFFP